MAYSHGKKLGALSALTIAIALTGCTDGGNAAPAPEEVAPGDETAGYQIPNLSDLVSAVTVDEELAGMVPADIAEAGVLMVGAHVQAPPNNFYSEDGSTVIGSEHDLITSIGNKLGLEVEHVNLDFGSLITSLDSGRIDVVMSAMNDNPERQQTIDFVNYLNSGIAILVAKGNPKDIQGPEGLCGNSIVVVTGTAQQKFAEETSAQCEEDGEEPIAIAATDSVSQNQIQLQTGRVDAMVKDLPGAVYAAQTVDDGEAFEVVQTDLINGAPYGIGVNKEDPELAEAIRLALDALIEDGTYDEIIDTWGVSAGKIDQATINAG